MKLNYLVLVLAAIAGFSSYSQRTQTDNEEAEVTGYLLDSETHRDFFVHLASLCGKSFAGEETYRSHHAPGWAHLDIVIHVEVCENEQILIPLHVGEDTSRTWMFLVEDGRLRLRHQHLYPDGTPEEDSHYGGYADNSGTALIQHFPADEYTAGVIEDGGGNKWTIMIDEEFNTLSYRLERDGEKRIRVDFDLNNPI